MISEDPALDRLRKESEFSSFKAMYFPSYGPARSPAAHGRPQNPQRLAQIRYTHDLLAELAHSWHEIWHTRTAIHARAAGYAQVDPHVLHGWCDGERDIWDLVREVADDGYDWRIRRDLIHRANALLPHDKPIVVRYCRHEERLLVAEGMTTGADYDRLLQDERMMAHRRLKALSALLRSPVSPDGDTGACSFERWNAAMRDYDPHCAISVEQRIQLCSRQAITWHKLSEWLRAGRGVDADRAGQDIQKAYAAFVDELTMTATLWADCVKASENSRATCDGVVPRVAAVLLGHNRAG